MIGSYLHLCQAAKKLGVWPELHAGTGVRKIKNGAGLIITHRDLIELRLVHGGGKVLASEPMHGIGDLDRAARALQSYVA